MKRRGHGFTLLEVLVAFTVLGLILGAALRVFGSGLGAVARDADYSRAVMLARSRLAEIEAADEIPGDGESGEFDQRFSWSVRTAPYAPPEEFAEIERLRPYTARVEVRWDDAGRERTVALDTLLLAVER